MTEKINPVLAATDLHKICPDEKKKKSSALRSKSITGIRCYVYNSMIHRFATTRIKAHLLVSGFALPLVPSVRYVTRLRHNKCFIAFTCSEHALHPNNAKRRTACKCKP